MDPRALYRSFSSATFRRKAQLERAKVAGLGRLIEHDYAEPRPDIGVSFSLPSQTSQTSELYESSSEHAYDPPSSSSSSSSLTHIHTPFVHCPTID